MNKIKPYIDDTAIIDDNTRVAKNVFVYRNCRISYSKLFDHVSIGDDSLVRYSQLYEQVEIGRRNTIDHAVINKGTYTGEFSIIKYCDIGKYCSVSWNVSIGGANHNIKRIASTPTHRIFTSTEEEKYKSFSEEDVTIGSDVWIGSGAIICRGVTIGNGAVIGAGAIVTKDVPPYAIVVGVPAKIINYRFNKNQINILEKISWWDWPTDKLLEAKELFFYEVSDSILEELLRLQETI